MVLKHSLETGYLECYGLRWTSRGGGGGGEGRNRAIFVFMYLLADGVLEQFETLFFFSTSG